MGGPVAASEHLKRINLFLIKPSKYDDEGYVIRHFRGVLPSNTLACLHSLTRDVVRQGLLGKDLQVRIHLIDETVQRVRVDRIARTARRQGAQTIICLVGVQTNQYPRAYDLAMQFRAHGLTVLLGGFHVSGLLALIPEIPEDLQTLIDRGVTIVKGEVEEAWGEILQAAVEGRLKPVYDFLDDKPDLRHQPIPAIHQGYLKRFAFSKFGTIDAGRGCPFDCSFCTIINVQGKKMRYRDPERIAEIIREQYRRDGVYFYFFTDDNFARNPNWEKIFDTIIRLREEEGIPVEFTIQVDLLCHKIPHFIRKASRAGCSQVFIGMESINAENLKAAAKTQNKVEEYRDFIAAWHHAGVVTHVGYIIGFPHDRPETVREDVRRLAEEIQVDMASFFLLTPLPGSMDHLEMVRKGEPLDPDYNRYDSFHETIRHPHFAPGELFRAYREAWESFYNFDHMKAALLRSDGTTYWNIFKNYVWYKNGILEREHPMITGFFRLKHRLDRRPGFPVETRWAYARRRYREIKALLKGWAKLFVEMEELWLQTRGRSLAPREWVQEARQRLADVALQIRGIDGLELGQVRQRLLDLFRRSGLHAGELKVHLQEILGRVRVDRQNLKHQIADLLAWVERIDGRQMMVQVRAETARRSREALGRLNIFSIRRITSRADLHTYWTQTVQTWRSRRFFRLNPLKIAYCFLRDLKIALYFFYRVFVLRTRLAEQKLHKG
jgi:radical SAM superfamily enzyme YgiQ (UPF0313 family)